MKNTIKMSLVAALAVSALTTSASAVNLEDAIKGVDVSGMVRYRYEEQASGLTGGTSSQTNAYDAEMNTKVPVNDAVTANLKFDVSGKLDADGSTATSIGDTKPSVNLEDVYFTYNAGVATVMAGKQNIPGPFTDGAEGTGLVALVPVGPVTVAAAWFNSHSVTDTAAPLFDQADVSELALLGKFGPVNFDIFYADVANIQDNLSIHASAKIADMVTVDARHTVEGSDTAGTPDQSLSKIVVSGKVADVSLAAGYATTDKNGGNVAIDNASDAAVDFKVWQLSTAKNPDADVWMIQAGMPLGPVNASLTYADASIGTNTDADETLAKIAYPMSKNFTVSAQYSQYNLDDSTPANKDVDSSKGRLELKYTF